MECEKLIIAVQEKIPLWDMRDKGYHSRDIQRKLWAKVAEEMSSNNVAEVKKKWKGLRDVFRREYKKSYKSGQEAPKEISSVWPFFHQMRFITSVMESRELKGGWDNSSQNKSSETNDEHHTEVCGENEFQFETPNASEIHNHPQPQPQPSIETPSPLPTARNRKRKRTENNNSEEKFLQIEKAKLQLFAENSAIKKDSDYQFLIRLLPYLKKVPLHRKLLVRNKLQQVLIDEDQLLYTSSGTPSPASWTTESTTITIPTTDNIATEAFHSAAAQPVQHARSSLMDAGLQDYFVNFSHNA